MTDILDALQFVVIAIVVLFALIAWATFWYARRKP
jgi:hypothetical protein